LHRLLSHNFSILDLAEFGRGKDKDCSSFFDDQRLASAFLECYEWKAPEMVGCHAVGKDASRGLVGEVNGFL
jgi:hypothetical protein